MKYKGMPKKGFVIRSSEVRSQLQGSLEDQIEMLNLKLKDAEEINERLSGAKSNLDLANAELSARLEAEQEFRNRQNDINWKLNAAEGEQVRLSYDLKREIANRDHFRALVAEQDKTIKLIKSGAIKTEEEFKKILEARKNEVDHLARQCVKQNEDNAQLRTDNCQFKEQTTRLIEENRKLHEEVRTYACEGARTGRTDSYCGGCVSCKSMQSDHSFELMDQALQKERDRHQATQDILRKRWEQIEVYVEIVKAFKKWPCLWWNDKNKYINDCQTKLTAYQTEVDNIRKDLAEGKYHSV